MERKEMWKERGSVVLTEFFMFLFFVVMPGAYIANDNCAPLPPSTVSNLGWKEMLVDSGVRFLEKR